MAYSGRYIVNNTKKYKGDFTKVIYRSLWERNAFKWCDENPKVKAWASEEVVIPYYYEVDKRYHRYFVDLKIVTEEKTILVEIKPEKETTPPIGEKRTKKYINENVALKILGKTSDISNMTLYLASDEAKYITGAIFKIDGGQLKSW